MFPRVLLLIPPFLVYILPMGDFVHFHNFNCRLYDGIILFHLLLSRSLFRALESYIYNCLLHFSTETSRVVSNSTYPKWINQIPPQKLFNLLYSLTQWMASLAHKSVSHLSPSLSYILFPPCQPLFFFWAITLVFLGIAISSSRFWGNLTPLGLGAEHLFLS